MIKLNVKQLTNRKKVVGLISADKPYSVYFKTRFGIHTFGMKFPIDVLILDSANRIVKMKQNMKANRVFLWPIVFENVVELPIGTIDKKNIKVGEEVELNFI